MFFIFSNLFRSCYISLSFLIRIHFTVFNFNIHLYTKSTILNFYFPSYPYCIRPVVRVLSKIFNEFWPILWKFYSWLWTKRTNLFIFRGLTTTEILVWVLYLLSTVLEIWLYSCFLFVFHWWPLNIWPDLDLDLFDSHLILLNLPF